MKAYPRRRFLGLAGATLVAPAVVSQPFVSRSLVSPAFAQQWPDRPIRAMVPFAPGSAVDLITRIVAEPLSRRLGQPVVVENRGGAGGTIGTAATAKAAADGYTLLMTASAHSAGPAAYPQIAYDPGKDFDGVIVIGSLPNVVVASPSKGWKTLDDLVKAAKAAAQPLSFSSAGVGSATHWAAERLRASAGFEAVHVPFKSGPDAITDTVTGRVDFMCPGLSSVVSLLRDGRLTALAVCTPERSAALPDVPTTLEAGYERSDYTYWIGMLAPAGTPRPIVDRLHAEIKEILALPEVRERFAPQGIEPMPMTPQEFDALIVKEIALNHEIVKAAGLKF